uniref:TF-B3 domain-containing protein n=1 Tax=Aegilops tauschii TaxID=37682 RepID=M8C9G0_AEGTA
MRFHALGKPLVRCCHHSSRLEERRKDEDQDAAWSQKDVVFSGFALHGTPPPGPGATSPFRPALRQVKETFGAFYSEKLQVSLSLSQVIPERFVNYFAWKLSGTIELEAPNGEDSPYEHESSESDDHTLPTPLYVLSGKCYVTEEDDANIVELVQEIQPEMPSLVAMMTKPSAKPYPDVVIPKDYALAHFPRKNQTIKLQLPEQSKKWYCEFHNPYMMAMGAELTEVQDKIVLEKVGAIASDLPIYVAVMTKTNVRVSLTFGTEYAAKYLRKGDRNLVLQQWHGVMRDHKGALRISGGWTSFASENGLTSASSS